jgi:hypothetical protein
MKMVVSLWLRGSKHLWNVGNLLPDYAAQPTVYSDDNRQQVNRQLIEKYAGRIDSQF